MTTTRPNILVFMTDQQHHATIGPDSLGATPNLNRLIAEGVRFENAFCPSPICTPSRSSFQTGVFPHQHKHIHNIHVGKNLHINEDFPENTILLGEALQRAGYRTGYIGKWDSGLKKSPLDYGYEIYDHNPYGDRSYAAVHQRQHVRIPYEPNPKQSLLSAETDEAPQDSGPFRVARKTVEVLKQWTATQDRPFYLFASTLQPHVPWHCPESYAGKVDPASLPEPPSFRDDFHGRPLSYRRLYNGNNYCCPGLPWPEMARAISHYHGVISLIDDAFGLIVRTLEECGVLDNTLIVFTSDHGEFMGAHGLIGKNASLLEDIVRVPLVVSWPNRFKPAVRKEFVHLTDLFATIVSLAGADVPVPAVSRNMTPLLEGGCPAAFPDVAFFEHHGSGSLTTVRGIRTNRMKYVYRPAEMDELYDLVNDPFEIHNLIDDPQYADALRGLKHQLLQWMQDTADQAARMTRLVFEREGVARQ